MFCRFKKLKNTKHKVTTLGQYCLKRNIKKEFFGEKKNNTDQKLRSM